MKGLHLYPDSILCLEGANYKYNSLQVALLHVVYNVYCVGRGRSSVLALRRILKSVGVLGALMS